MKTYLKYSIYVLILASLMTFSSCFTQDDYQSDARPVPHVLWDTLVKEHVAENGDVDYKGFIADSAKLENYLNLLKSAHPNNSWSRNEKMAYWINAYNAFTVKLIVDHYPIQSIKDIKNGIPFVNTVWDIQFIKIEGATYDLNNVEHGILRPKFKDYRIHFAVNCASVSCPRIRNEAYVAERLDEQLDDQARYFLRNTAKNKISDPNNIQISKLFDWYKGDFTKKGTVIDYLNQYAPIQINEDAEIEYMDYDWNLNDVES